MTVVIGRRFGDTIIMLSDTMISDADAGIRTLQRKLYRKAKAEPAFRF
jgi:hypothetical protein